MKVKMLKTLSPACDYDKNHIFHKGKTYNAVNATNQPNWKEKGLIFVEKKNGYSFLVEMSDYISL